MAEEEKKDTFNFREEQRTDRYALHHCWMEQAGLFAKYSEAWSDARDETVDIMNKISLAEDKVKETVAKLDLKIRTNWAAEVNEEGETIFAKQPTETAISNLILLKQEYKDALWKVRALKQELLDKKRIENRLKQGKETFEQRKASLEGLTKLLLAGYYSEPYIPPDAKEDGLSKSQGEHQEHINSSIKRRRKL